MVPTSIVSSTVSKTLFPTLPFCGYVSPPVVAWYESALSLSFMLGRGEFVDADRGYMIWPPSLLAIYDVQNGGLIDLRSVAPKDFGRKDAPDAPLGKGTLPVQKATAEYIGKLAKFFELSDQLLKAVCEGKESGTLRSDYNTALYAVNDQALHGYVKYFVDEPT